MPEPKNIKFFKTEEALRKWYEKYYSKLDEFWIGYYKKGSGKPSVTYSQAVDQALCFGWIDGIAKGIDEEKYCQRFTPRRAKSIWSAVNHKKVAELIKNKQMTPAGLKTYNERDKARTNMYSFEQAKHELPTAYEKKFKQNKKAWANFQKMPPSYRKPAIWWVISAKQEETQMRRLGTLIDDSENGLRIKQLRPLKKNVLKKKP
jgi:uncharacterized protein YdeI (YjbR/CyaY-like superfamily)